MAKYKHILVATDLSEASIPAGQRAKELAKFYGARLSIVHAVDYVPPGYVSIELPKSLASAENLVEQARELLARWVEKLGAAQSTQWVEVGSAKVQIMRIAEENSVDLIVIGTHSAHTLDLILGSTANAVLHRADCDVLAVRAA